MIRNCMKTNVVSIRDTATIQEAARLMSEKHIGFLPVLDQESKLVGMVGLPDLLTLEMPAFINLISDLDFINDFGAVETNRPNLEQISQSISSIIQPEISVHEDSGKLLAFGIMLKHNLTDLPVITEDGKLVGVVSRVDIGAAILEGWKEIKDS